MWTANITNKSLTNGQLVCNLEFTNGVDTLFEVFTLSNPSDLIPLIKRRITQLTNLYTFEQTLALGPVTIPTETIDTAKENYLTLLGKWRTVKLDIENGLLKNDDPAVITLVADLKDAYKPEYSGL
jgi:hypothetical protein